MPVGADLLNLVAEPDGTILFRQFDPQRRKVLRDQVDNPLNRFHVGVAGLQFRERLFVEQHGDGHDEKPLG